MPCLVYHGGLSSQSHCSGYGFAVWIERSTSSLLLFSNIRSRCPTSCFCLGGTHHPARSRNTHDPLSLLIKRAQHIVKDSLQLLNGLDDLTSTTFNICKAIILSGSTCPKVLHYVAFRSNTTFSKVIHFPKISITYALSRFFINNKLTGREHCGNCVCSSGFKDVSTGSQLLYARSKTRRLFGRVLDPLLILAYKIHPIVTFVNVRRYVGFRFALSHLSQHILRRRLFSVGSHRFHRLERTKLRQSLPYPGRMIKCPGNASCRSATSAQTTYRSLKNLSNCFIHAYA